MEELDVKPTPLPRSSPNNHLQEHSQEVNQLRKPVPLPRTTKAIAVPSKGTLKSKDDKVGSESSSFEDVFTRSFKPSTLTKSLKKKLKCASGNVQGKSKIALETTRNFGLRTERSFKGILQKRQSASPHLSMKQESDSAAKTRMDRCQSLPSDNIFSSIKFESPIQQDDVDNLYDADNNGSLPPPEYPPPPPPDESIYDELSTKSSYSGSHGDYYTCPSVISSSSDMETDIYLSDLKHLSLCAGGSDSNSSSTAEGLTDSFKSRVNDFRDSVPFHQSHDHKVVMDEEKVTVSRSESWSFYDTVVVTDPHQNEQSGNVIVPKSVVCKVPQDLVNNSNTQSHAVKIVVGGVSQESQNRESDFKSNDQYVNVTIDGKSTITNGFNSENSLKKNEQYVNVAIQANNESSSSCKSQTEHKVTALKPLQPFKINNSSEHKSIPSLPKGQESVISSTESEGSSVSLLNELYQNWQPSMLSKYPQNKTFTKSYFSEFDPLDENYSSDKKTGNAGSLPLFCPKEDRSEFDDDFDTVSLPVPPKRYDSFNSATGNEGPPEIPNDVEYVLYHRPTTNLPVRNKTVTTDCKEDHVKNNSVTKPEKSSSESSEDREPSPGKERTGIIGWTSMAIRKISEGSHWSPSVSRKAKKSKDEVPCSVSKLECISSVAKRPVIISSSGPIHNGWLYRSSSTGEKQKDFVRKQCQLAEGCLTLTSEQNSSSKDLILLEHIYSLQIVRETRQSNEGEDLYCMEISCSLREKPHCLGCICTADRRIWMQKLLDSLTRVFPTRLTTEYSRAGWCFMKEGISSEWLAAWILLRKRTLYVNPCPGKMSEVDLRKARCIVLQESEEGCVRVADKGPLLRIDSPNFSYYLQMDETRETKTWCRVLRKAAVENGPELHDQQLTKDDLPTIVDKCINFVYAHGSMSEGIYRRSGSNLNVTKLLTAFQTDAWAVQIAKNEYSEHDVASVLKRFFRDLREPLLTSQLHKVLCNAAELQCSEEEKVALYRSQLEKLPPVNYVSTRRLMGHLHHISQNCERNLMPVENLAAIWGPTLMHVGVSENGMDPNWSRSESLVVSDLILLYPRLFLVDGAEMAREQRIQEVLERYHNSVQQTPHTTKPSGDIKVWIYIGSRDSDCVSVSISPQREALDVCNELCPKMNVYGHELCLLESVLGGVLIRPLHHSERVLDTVLRWGYWDDTDCKNNCLILVINTILRDIAPIAKPPVAQCGELRFADLKSKNFKVFLFEFSQAKLCYYKDKTGSVKVQEWKIEDIVWYIGHEPKRNPHTRWSLTFIHKNNRSKRSKENPFFGFTIAGVTRDEQLRWMAAMLVGEYPHIDLLPSPQLNLLD